MRNSSANKSGKKKAKPPVQVLEKWTGGHSRGRLDLPASNIIPEVPKKKKRKAKD